MQALEPSPAVQRGGGGQNDIRVPDMQGTVSIQRSGGEGGDAATERFLAGYRSAGGPALYDAHLVNDVLPCEGNDPEIEVAWYDHFTIPYRNGYISPAQFSPDSWATAALHTGLSDPTDVNTVGANTGWWIKALEAEGSHPGGSGGWSVCWWRGVVP